MMELDDIYSIGTPKSPTASFFYAIRIGIVGYGKLGQYLVDQLLTEGSKYRLDLAFIWNRTALTEKERSKILVRCPLVKFLEALEQIRDMSNIDLIVEVCHPSIVHKYADLFLEKAHFLLGSTTALADDDFRNQLFNKLLTSQNRMFVARGALWSGNDIQMMARKDRIMSVELTMTFHPRSLRLTDPKIRKLNEELMEGEPRSLILFEGPARDLCQIAPNNVNTIATAALAGIGFDKTIGRLISDSSLCDYHTVEMIIQGQPTIDGKQFEVRSIRKSPTVTSQAVSSIYTLNSFWISILQCTGSFTRINDSEIQIC